MKASITVTLALIILSGCGRPDPKIEAIVKAAEVAQQRYHDCLFSHSRAMYRGNDTAELEKQISDSCRPELENQMAADVVGFEHSPAMTENHRKMDEAAVPVLTHAAFEEAIYGSNWPRCLRPGCEGTRQPKFHPAP